jgi:hypothetical protein
LILERHTSIFDPDDPNFANTLTALGFSPEPNNAMAFDYIFPINSNLWQPLLNFFNDSKRSGDLYYPEEQCYIYITSRWLTILREGASPTG